MSMTPEDVAESLVDSVMWNVIGEATISRDQLKELLQQAAKQFRDGLTADDGVEIARDKGYLVQAWQPGDIEGEIDSLAEFRDDWDALTDAQRAALVAAAQKTRSWGMLADATETDWMLVHNAIDAGAEQLGIRIRV